MYFDLPISKVNCTIDLCLIGQAKNLEDLWAPGLQVLRFWASTRSKSDHSVSLTINSCSELG